MYITWARNQNAQLQNKLYISLVKFLTLSFRAQIANCEMKPAGSQSTNLSYEFSNWLQFSDERRQIRVKDASLQRLRFYQIVLLSIEAQK